MMIQLHLPTPTRRHLLGGGVAIMLLPAAARRRPLRISLLGQALIKTDLRPLGWADEAAFRTLLGSSDIIFTDLETVIAGPLAGQSTRPADSEVLHVGDPAVIACLQAIGVNLVATSNNHAWDLDTGGILSTIAALRARRLTFAGTGRTLAEASAPGFVDARGRVALVAAAAGAIRDGAAATATRAGVNELRRDDDGTMHAVDVDRYLAAIKFAAKRGATVIAYLHNHYWEARKADTPGWQRDLARRAIDAGAATFAAHGVPEMQGVEFYRGAPLFHGLGSFVFQSEKPDGAYGPEAWQSLIAQIRVDGGRVAETRLVPVQLDARGIMADGRRVRGSPRVATGADAQTIFARVRALAAALDAATRFDPVGAAPLALLATPSG